MNDYKIRLIDNNGNEITETGTARSAQEMANEIRKYYKNCYILWIAEIKQDWK